MNVISIIIPIYNAEKSIEKCLDSINSQTYTNWEAIIIDDGSSDKSGIICDEYTIKDARFKVTHTKNVGASSARNKGIELATGDWITFIDADDYVDKEYLEVLTSNITSDNKTLIIQGLKEVTNIGSIIKKNEFENEILSNAYIKKAFNEKEIFKYGYTVAKLYNRQTINEQRIRFNEAISYSEDLLFMLEYILHCDRIKFIGGAHYNYVTEASILSQRYNSFESEYLLFQTFIKLIKEISITFSFEIPRNTLKYGGLILMRSLYSMYVNKYNRKTRIKNISQIRKEHKSFIRQYYMPQLPLFKIIKSAFLIHSGVFDIICKIKFR